MSKRFVSWAAVSSLPQAKKVSLEDQLDTNRQHAERHNGEIVAELVVPGESRYIILFEDACRKMDAYARLAQLIEQRAFDVLIYLDRSRLGRRATLSMAVVELCHDAGILTYEIESPPASLEMPVPSHDDMLIGAIKSVGAQREIQKLQERHKMGMIDRVRRGKFSSTTIPFGWVEIFDRAGNGTIKINETAATILKMIFKLYLDHNMGVEAIANELNRLGFKTARGLEWHKQNVHQVFDRVWRYAGQGEINVKSKDRPYFRAAGAWPAIITTEMAHLILEEKERRKTARRSIGNTYRFSLCVMCAECGNRMTYNVSRRARTPSKLQYQLRCVPGNTKSSPKYSFHRHTSVSERNVFAGVLDTIKHLQDPTVLEKVIGQVLAIDPTEAEKDLSAKRIEVERLKKQLFRVDEMYVGGDLDEERYRAQVNRINEEIKVINHALEQALERVVDLEYQNQRADRIRGVAREGMGMLALEDLKLANAWMKRHLLIWVRDCAVERIDFV